MTCPFSAQESRLQKIKLLILFTMYATRRQRFSVAPQKLTWCQLFDLQLLPKSQETEYLSTQKVAHRYAIFLCSWDVEI